MIRADSLLDCKACIDGKWVVARPLQYSSIIVLLKDVWAVLTKKALAVSFYKQ